MLASRARPAADAVAWAAVLAWAAVVAWASALAAVLLWPITRTGYLLGHDMVFTPRQPLDLASIGLSTGSPRAVPVDALVALAERVADGAVVGRLALVLPAVAAGIGAAALLRDAGIAGRLAACGFAIWNPYVVERLGLGQWALLWCYAALPWLVLAVSRVHGRWAWPARAAALAAASITPTGGLVAVVTAVATAAGTRRSRREVAGVAALAVTMQLAWLVPAAVSTASGTSDPAGIAAFAARAERPGGVLLTLLGGGGIWDRDVTPGSRCGALAWLGLAVLVAAAVVGSGRLRALLGRRLTMTLVWLAAAALLLAVLASVPGGRWLLERAVAHVPGAGLLRDAQKWLLPFVLLEALLAGAAIDVLARRLRAAPGAAAAVVVAGLAVPVLLLPDGPAALRPTLRPVHYPHDWAAARQVARGGDAVVLPFQTYRAFAWAPGRTVFDPASALVDTPTVQDDLLVVSGRVIAGEDLRARRVAAALDGGPGLASRLATFGIRWVIVEHGTPGTVPALDGLVAAHTGPDVSVFRVPGAVPAPVVSTGRIVAVAMGDAAAGSALVGTFLWVLIRKRRDQRPQWVTPDRL